VWRCWCCNLRFLSCIRCFRFFPLSSSVRSKPRNGDVNERICGVWHPLSGIHLTTYLALPFLSSLTPPHAALHPLPKPEARADRGPAPAPSTPTLCVPYDTATRAVRCRRWRCYPTHSGPGAAHTHIFQECSEHARSFSCRCGAGSGRMSVVSSFNVFVIPTTIQSERR
jgi:hypothetical protein